MESDTVELNLLKTDSDAIIPEYKTPGSSGMDLCSIEDKIINSKSIEPIKTGISLEIPDGYEIEVRSRSGLALKYGIFVLNSPGTVDSDYRGELQVILANFGNKKFEIKKGDRIAQIILSKVARARISIKDQLSKTKRGSGGFGSTGI